MQIRLNVDVKIIPLFFTFEHGLFELSLFVGNESGLGDINGVRDPVFVENFASEVIFTAADGARVL